MSGLLSGSYSLLNVCLALHKGRNHDPNFKREMVNVNYPGLFSPLLSAGGGKCKVSEDLKNKMGLFFIIVVLSPCCFTLSAEGNVAQQQCTSPAAVQMSVND